MTEQSGDAPDPDLEAELAADLAIYQAEDAIREAEAGEDASELHPGLLPIAWMLGSWRGEGVAAGRPGEPDLTATLEATWEIAGGPVLAYRGRVLIGERVLSSESGFWRATPDGFEVVLAHDSGVLEVLVGSAAFSRLELISDLVARTLTAPSDTASTRLYGLVEGRLLYAVDVATEGNPLRSRVSGGMGKV